MSRPPEAKPAVTAPPPGIPRPRRPTRARALPGLIPHLLRTTPWPALLAGCASGTLVLAVLAHFAGDSPLDQSTVRITLLPAVAALCFTPHTHSRHIVQTAPLPAWITTAGQTLLALPLLAATCWGQLHLMAETVPAGETVHLPAIYPLIAQFTAWSLFAAAIAGCYERTRHASLSGAIAVPVSTALIAVAEFTPALQRRLLTPPATPQAAAIAWYTLAAAALSLAGIAIRDQWHRYTHRLHRQLRYTRR
jgi:hypothetical protein